MNEEPIYKEHKLKDSHILQVFKDTWAESPRTWYNLGTMAIFHTRYNFGDEIDFSSDDFKGWEEIEEHIKTNLKAVVILPIYMYDHGGITINTQGFSCPWDSGQVGFIYVTEDRLKKEYSVPTLTGYLVDKASKTLKQEVKTLDMYLRGEIYGFHLVKRIDNKEEEIDACSGFYGDDIHENGMLGHIAENLK